jgi:pyruvate dehydrogenase E1 component alpha subunit
MDVLTVFQTAIEAVAHARSGNGPILLEFVSYRFSGQFEGDAQTYQPAEEIARARERDPIRVFRDRAAERGLDPGRLEAIEAEVRAAVDAAFAAAERAPWPRPEDTLEDVYVSY